MKFTEIPVDAKYIKHTQAARFHDVHVKTLDRWAEAGIIPKPVVVNGLKYHAVDDLAAAGRRRG